MPDINDVRIECPLCWAVAMRYRWQADYLTCDYCGLDIPEPRLDEAREVFNDLSCAERQDTVLRQKRISLGLSEHQTLIQMIRGITPVPFLADDHWLTGASPKLGDTLVFVGAEPGDGLPADALEIVHNCKMNFRVEVSELTADR